MTGEFRVFCSPHMNKQVYSQFECEKLVVINDKKEWVKENVYYHGDLSNIDLTRDWRFCEVKDKRKQLKFIGLVYDKW